MSNCKICDLCNKPVLDTYVSLIFVVNGYAHYRDAHVNCIRYQLGDIGKAFGVATPDIGKERVN